MTNHEAIVYGVSTASWKTSRIVCRAGSGRPVYEAAREAHMKHDEQLLVIGFAIEPNARAIVDKVDRLVGIPATYVQATPDLVMGDLLKTASGSTSRARRASRSPPARAARSRSR